MDYHHYNRWDKKQVIEALINVTRELDKENDKKSRLIKLLQANNISNSKIASSLKD